MNFVRFFLLTKLHLFHQTANLCLLILVFALSGKPVFAQSTHVGIMLGVSNYWGELSPTSWVMSETHPAVALSVRHELNTYLSLRGQLSYAMVSGNDANSNDYTINLRNLHFKSNIWEASIQALIEPFGNQNRFIPYVYGGIGIFRFSPKARDREGNWVELQPLGTEGQGLGYDLPRFYSRTQVMLPVGIGIRYKVNEQWEAGIEGGFRKIFTDYLDDVSTYYFDNAELRRQRGDLAADMADQTDIFLNNDDLHQVAGDVRGNPESSDGYFIVGLTLSYKFRDGGSERYGCAKF